MTENFEPVAQEPVAPAAPTYPQPPRAAGPWKWLGVTAVAAAAGLGGFVVGNHNDTIRPAAHMQQWNGNGRGPLSGGNGPMPGNGPMQGNGPMGDGRGFGMGPHCEDTNGNHAAVNPDGSCPSGYTLDDRGGMRFDQPAPGASASTGTQG